MQLSGELSKVSLPNLLQLVRTGALTGKLSFSQGARHATVYVRNGFPIHADLDGSEGLDPLLELFLWTSGTFSFDEADVETVTNTLKTDVDDGSFERLLKDGVLYSQQSQLLEDLSVSASTILQPTGTAISLAKQAMARPGLELLDGKKTLAEALSKLEMSKREFVRTVASWLADGLADVATRDKTGHKSVELPAWVVARLKQDHSDTSQAIIDMVIWVDRVKCWLYQADAEFWQIRKDLEELASQEKEEPDEDLGSEDEDLEPPPAPPSDSNPSDTINPLSIFQSKFPLTNNSVVEAIRARSQFFIPDSTTLSGPGLSGSGGEPEANLDDPDDQETSDS